MSHYLLTLAEAAYLESERLSLRPLSLGDAEDMYEYAADEETTKYVFETHRSVADTKENLAKYFLNQPLGKYGIVLKAEQKLIGTVDIRVNDAHGKAEIGYTLNKKYWGQGYTTEAGARMLTLAFEQLKLNRVEAKHDSRNPASGRVMAKLGMIQEAVLRDEAILKGEVTTTVIYGMTKDDYRKRQENE